MTTNAPLVFVSQLQHKDVLPYIVALKSVYRTFGEGGVVILNDGSLTEKDKATLKEHIIGLEILALQDVDLQGLPSGGTWERLVTLIDQSKTRYAIQLDADIVAVKAISEVK